MRLVPARNPKPSEDGFILIEVLVSALILAMVAAAVLALLSSTTRSSASQRLRSQAAALAQEDQARMRTMRLTKLNGLSETRAPVTLDGTDFTVKSQGTFVNAASNEVSCSGEASVADYVRITSEVSSAAMLNPVVVRSIVSPSSGSLDQNHGILSFNVRNADGRPVSGISFSGRGPVNFSGFTDSTGCANFADLTAGTYSFTVSANGMVTPQGEASITKTSPVKVANTTRIPLEFDVPGGVEPKFYYRVGNSSTQFLPASTDSIQVYNGGTGATVPTTVGVPGSARGNPFKGPTNLYPFNSNTSIYAGACTTNNPDPTGSSAEKQKAMANIEIQPGITATPEIQLPALNLNLTSDGAPVKGALVTTVDTNSKCEYASRPVKRKYTTEAGGHLARIETIPGRGEVLIPDAGMPWGKYRVCASAPYRGGGTRKVEATVSVESLSAGTPLDLDLKNSLLFQACSWP